MNKVPGAHIEALVKTLIFSFSRIEDSTTTICIATLPNGFRVGLGDSICLDPDEYDLGLGKKWAKEEALKNATENLWQLEGYLLKMTGRLSPVSEPEPREKTFEQEVSDILTRYGIQHRDELCQDLETLKSNDRIFRESQFIFVSEG